MRAGITIKQVWSDDDLVELEVTSSDGISMFCTRVYVSHGSVEQLIGELDVFRNHLHGGLCNIVFGQFGPEYACGAFEARLHFYKPGRLAITVRAESEWREFKNTQVASNATLHFMSEPVLLDNFHGELKQLKSGASSEAALWSAV